MALCRGANPPLACPSGDIQAIEDPRLVTGGFLFVEFTLPTSSLCDKTNLDAQLRFGGEIALMSSGVLRMTREASAWFHNGVGVFRMKSRDVPNWALWVLSACLMIITAFAGAWADGLEKNQLRIERKVDDAVQDSAMVKERIRGVEVEVKGIGEKVDSIDRGVQMLLKDRFESHGFTAPE